MVQANSHAEKTYWIVVANEAQAIIYTRSERRSPLVESLSLENAEARKKKGEILTDRGGRSFDSFGAGRHTMAIEKTDPKKQAAIAFAKQVAERIAKVVHEGSCRGYALVAAPRFLGLLRDAVSRQCKMAPFRTIDKDVVGRDTTFLQKLVDSD